MSKLFNFHALKGTGSGSTEANIFIHGYSAGHNTADRRKLLESIPESVSHYTNIFAFWDSSHFSHFNNTSFNLISASARLHWAAIPATIVGDRAAHFWCMRSRAEDMGRTLLDQLSTHLSNHHPQIDTINLIGHSLGGRLIVSSLQHLAEIPEQRLAINDVLLMAAAVEVAQDEAKRIRRPLQGRLINAYSNADKTLLMNMGETCLGRNPVEHFENIELEGFGHTDYWDNLHEVLACTQFKFSPQTPQSQVSTTTAQLSLSPQPSENRTMTLDLNNPSGIYQRINNELGSIIGSLNGKSKDESLNQAKNNSHKLLSEYQKKLQTQLAELEKNAVWDTFTIAFYGETGAGKSTLIETLRILLQEPSKLASQQAFREAQERYDLNENKLQQLQQSIEQTEARLGELERQLEVTLQQYAQPHSDVLKAIDQADARLGELTQQLGGVLQQHEQLHGDALAAVTQLRTLIAERKQTASLWQKLLNLLRKMPEEVELGRAEEKLSAAAAARNNSSTALIAQQSEVKHSKIALEQQLAEIAKARDSASKPLLRQQAEAEHNKITLFQQRQEIESQRAELLRELERLADGEIIGDGRADFTRRTQRYEFTLAGQPFALLDVPGIEGNEDLIRSQIGQAVQTAHAVFYVTNQAAPPQTGDEERKGTLEKIKEHLGAQTEVWTIFNKKITNPKHALGSRPLISDDEKISLDGLDEKMREQLGAHYREVFPLTALPAFLASTKNFPPGSQNSKRRSKALEGFSAKELLEKSRVRDFLQLLGRQLLPGSKAKITRANFNKAKEALDQAAVTIGAVQGTFAELGNTLDRDGKSAQKQLNSSFNALKQRLESSGETLIDNFASIVRNKMYEIIDSDISNDDFKDALHAQIQEKQEKLSNQLPSTMGAEIEKFQKDAEEIFKRFEEQARELTAIYSKLNNTQLHGQLDLDIKLDNGLKITNLLVALAGGALLWWNPAGWFFIAMGVASIAVGAYKAVRGFFSSDYKKAQQRKATEDNLRNVTEQLRHSLRDGLKKALPEMQQKIGQLEQALEAPAKQALVQAQLLNQSVNQLKTISRQIGNAGNL